MVARIQGSRWSFSSPLSRDVHAGELDDVEVVAMRIATIVLPEKRKKQTNCERHVHAGHSASAGIAYQVPFHRPTPHQSGERTHYLKRLSG